MNRLEKKCFFVSCILHVVFLSVLVYRSDLFAEKPVKPVKIPILNVISAEAVDALKSPGGVLEEPPKKKDPPKSKPKEPSPKPKPKPEVTKDPPKKDPPKPKSLLSNPISNRVNGSLQKGPSGRVSRPPKPGHQKATKSLRR